MKDALYWVEQMRNRAISWQECADVFCGRYELANKQVNALVTWDIGAAKRMYEKGVYKNTTFLGLPIPLKMLGQTKAGWLDTSASKLLQQHRGTKTANFVKQLERIGCIPLGQTNAPEFGFKNITDSQLYGAARNPWHLDYSPGGSSGGAAAAVASGIVPAAAASDGGGSIRIPASFCGLIGLKPTRGNMPVGPGGWRGWQGAAIDFAVTVSMRDTKALFAGLKGTPKAAPYQAPAAGAQKKSSALRVAWFDVSPVGTSVSADARRGLRETLDFLEEQGHQIIEIACPVDGEALINSYYVMNAAETAAMFAGIEAGRKEPLTSNDMELMTWTLYQYGQKISASEYIAALNCWDQAAAQMEGLFEEVDVLMTPTTAAAAPLISEDFQSDGIRDCMRMAQELSKVQLAQVVHEMFYKGLSLTPFTQLANLTGQPAISLPVAVASNGLPIGVQVMTSKSCEALLFQIGEELESANRFHLPPIYSKL